MRFAVVVSAFNPEVTGGLLEGARGYLREQGVMLKDEDVIPAPGAFELPLIARHLARKKKYTGVICLGCVIKGDTMHFEFISLAAAMGILQTGLECGKPVSFGVLTTLSEEQAVSRSRPDASNKGREAAAACLEAARTLRKIGR